MRLQDLYTMINDWLSQVRLDDEFYIKPTERDGIGWGATEAARGASSTLDQRSKMV